MHASSLIAGSLGATLIAGVLLVVAVLGAGLLVVLAPGDDGLAVREALVDAKDDLAGCAAGSQGGEMDVTLALHRGQAQHVGIAKATTSVEVANCVAETLVTRPWPLVSAAATVPVRFQR